MIPRKELARIRKLLSSKKWSTVKEGLEAIFSSGDTELAEIMIDGLRFLHGYDLDLQNHSEVKKRVLGPFRLSAALYLLKHAGGFPDLERLHLRDCPTGTDLSPLVGLSTLKSLSVHLSKEHRDLKIFAPFCRLQSIEFQRGTEVRNLSPLREFHALESLNLNEFESVRSLAPLGELSELRSLYLNTCSAVKDFSPISQLNKLTSLWLFGNVGMTDLSIISGKTALTRLEVGGNLTDYSALEGLTGLQFLRVASPTFTDLSRVRRLIDLEELHIDQSREISDLSPLANLKHLRVLSIEHADLITKRELLQELPRLEVAYRGETGQFGHEVTMITRPV